MTSPGRIGGVFSASGRQCAGTTAADLSHNACGLNALQNTVPTLSSRAITPSATVARHLLRIFFKRIATLTSQPTHYLPLTPQDLLFTISHVQNFNSLTFTNYKHGKHSLIIIITLGLYALMANCFKYS
jgi:hypothetical protein